MYSIKPSLLSAVSAQIILAIAIIMYFFATLMHINFNYTIAKLSVAIIDILIIFVFLYYPNCSTAYIIGIYMHTHNSYVSFI